MSPEFMGFTLFWVNWIVISRKRWDREKGRKRDEKERNYHLLLDESMYLLLQWFYSTQFRPNPVTPIMLPPLLSLFPSISYMGMDYNNSQCLVLEILSLLVMFGLHSHAIVVTSLSWMLVHHSYYLACNLGASMRKKKKTFLKMFVDNWPSPVIEPEKISL